MKKLLSLILPAALVLAMGTPAIAKDMRGRVASVDTEANEFTLRNGVTFYYSDDKISEEGLAAGAKVKVKYKSKSGFFRVTSLTVTSPADG
ncbi:MAG: hypothetical protein ACE363_04775 [Alphaproteobacteria bacterium]